MEDFYDEIDVHRGRLHQMRDTFLQLADGSRDPLGPIESRLLADWCDQLGDLLRGL